MGCNFSRPTEEEDDQQSPLDNGHQNDQQSNPHKKASKKKKHQPPHEHPVGNKLATSNDQSSSPPPLCGISPNGSIPPGDSTQGIGPPLTPDRLYKNFQERLSTQTSKNGAKLTDSQLEFFQMLDDKINEGKDYESERERESIA